MILSLSTLVGVTYIGKSQLAEKEYVQVGLIEDSGSVKEPSNQGDSKADDSETDLVSQDRMSVNYPFFLVGKDGYSYSKYDKGDFWAIKIPSTDQEQKIQQELPLEGQILDIYIMDQDHWKSIEVLPQEIKLEDYIFIVTDKRSYMFSRPDSYIDMGYGTRKSQDEIRMDISLELDEGNWSFTYNFQSQPYVDHVIWGISSEQKLLDFNDTSIESRFASYDFVNKARFLEDGYYYRSPESYLPTDKQAYWRIPSMYLVTHFVEGGNSLAEELLAKGWLDVGIKNINSEGYFATLPRSNWLYEDYGIEDGFFDTRFNGDMISTYLESYQKYGNSSYREAYLLLAYYYLSHAVNHHFSFGENGEGWLVYDYYHDGLGDLPVHTSLNHQIHAISMFLNLFLEEENYDYFDIAMHMLKGIRFTQDLWPNEEGDLHYAMLPDQTMGLSDYPVLTLNDMLKLQELLEKEFYGREPAIDMLIEVKKEYYGYE